VDRPSTSPETQRLYGGIAALLVEEMGAKPGQMMGMPTLFLGGKAFAGLSGDAMVFKLDGEVHASALALPGAALFDPSGMGRPMKAWVLVPVQHASEWTGLARSGAQGVASAG
jgi:hypothetical protein